MAKLRVPIGYLRWRDRIMKERLALATKHLENEKRKQTYIAFETERG